MLHDDCSMLKPGSPGSFEAALPCKAGSTEQLLLAMMGASMSTEGGEGGYGKGDGEAEDKEEEEEEEEEALVPLTHDFLDFSAMMFFEVTVAKTL